MAVQFFGQFLISRGEVDAVHIREALALMDEANPSIGRLAVERGLMQPHEVARISAQQRTRDAGFGDLCVENGLLGSTQLVELLRAQYEAHVPLGEALIRLGTLAPDRLAVLLDAFKAEQAQFTLDSLPLPDALANHRAARPILALFPRMSLRVARMHAKVGEVLPFACSPEFSEYRVSVPLHGTLGLDVAIVSDATFGERLAFRTTGVPLSELDAEIVADGMGEFLNVFLGNVISALSLIGHPMRLGSPDYEAELVDGWTVDLAVETGQAALVLSLF